MAAVVPYSPPTLCIGDWTLQNGEGCGNLDSATQESLAAEAINIAGAPIQVFKLLGVHEQGLLVDLTGSGYPLSSGSAAGFDASNAFNTAPTSTWQSIQQGSAVTSAPAFLGYYFGVKTRPEISPITLQPNGNQQNKYTQGAGVIRNLVTTIIIQQSANPINRVLQARVDRSDDGVTWKCVDTINLPNDETLDTIGIKQTAPAAYWRLVPLMFAGSATPTAYWEVIRLELLDCQATSIVSTAPGPSGLDYIEDIFLQENRDRDYATSSIQIKASYQPFDSIGDLSKFGFNLMEQYAFTCSFAVMVQALNRPIVVGDIVEVTPELQYDQNLLPVRKFLEITDAGWASDGFTTGWQPILYRFQGVQLIPAMENRDITSNDNLSDNQLTDAYGAAVDSDFFSGKTVVNNVAQVASDNIYAATQDAVPQTGVDQSTVSSGTSGHADPFDGHDYGVENGLPPDNLPYTQGTSLPNPSTASDGDYFRLNYPNDTNIPARLFRFSLAKFQWIYVETDRRQAYTSFKPSVRKILQSSTRRSLEDI